MPADTLAPSECPPEVSLYEDFARSTRDLELGIKQNEFYKDLLSLRDVPLSPAQAALREAITRELDGYFARYIEEQVSASFKWLLDLQARLLEYVARVNTMVGNWHRYLEQAVAPVPEATKYVLAAFSLVEDQTLTLNQPELDRLVEEAAREAGSKRDALLREARRRAYQDPPRNGRGGKLDDEVHDTIDIAALLIVLMKRAGLKPFVKDPKLQEWVVEYFAKSGSAVSPSFGGAAGNETFLGRRLGKLVLTHTPYHHGEQAKQAPPCARRLIFRSGGPQRRFPSLRDGNSQDPRRFSFVLQLFPEKDQEGNLGPALVIEGERLSPSKPDRVILRVPHPRTDREVPWKTLRVEWPGNETWKRDAGNDPIRWDAAKQCWFTEVGRGEFRDKDRKEVFADSQKDWPWLPVFQHPPQFDSESGVLYIRLASPEELGEISGELETVLLGGFQGLAGTGFPAALGELLRKAAAEQTRVLSEHQTVHFELSAVAEAAQLDVLKTLFHEGRVRDLSINREELIQITSQPASPYFAWPPVPPERAFLIYKRAAKFLTEMGSSTLYIHDLEMDILLIANQTQEDLADKTLEKHRQAMLLAKAAVPAALFRRAGQEPQFDLVLSSVSFLALLLFATEYAAEVAARMPGTKREDIFTAIAEHGYYRDPRDDGISVVVAPAIQVDFPKEVSISGAGDMSFAARAVALAADP